MCSSCCAGKVEACNALEIYLDIGANKLEYLEFRVKLNGLRVTGRERGAERGEREGRERDRERVKYIQI